MIYLGIGSNLGNRKKYIEKAKFNIIQNDISIIKSSNFYESLSWPDIKKPKFLNVVLQISSNLTPLKLMEICKKIEKSLGRIQGPKNSPRVCDIDIIDFNNRQFTKEIVLPHPRMHVRNFVLLPLFELNKDWSHPLSKNHIKTLILSLPDRDIRSIKQI